MNDEILRAAYELIAELCLNPSDRDPARVEALLTLREALPAVVREPLCQFIDTPGAHSVDEYTQTLELSPPCPLYVGTYLFDEPTSCRGAGTSGRNGYMLELTGTYRHFGLELAQRELPDFLPLMAEFAALSLAERGRDGIGLRRRFLEHMLAPALAPLRERLGTYQSPYGSLVRALEAVVAEDLAGQTEPAWQPPEGDKPQRRILPVMNDRARSRREAFP